MSELSKKDIREIFNEGVMQVMMPVLDKVFEDISVIKTDIKEIKGDISTLKEDVHDLQLTTDRIEMLQRHELDRVDDHEIRIIKLEKATVK